MDISLVIPVYNEEENIEAMHLEVTQVLAPTGLSYEVIYIDDGSGDNTFALLNKIAAADGRAVVIALRRNFGQTAAMSAGFDHARGDVVITLDGDLQNDPADIPRLLEKLNEGYDIVAGWRKDRKDKFVTRRFPSQVANRLISKITGVKLHDYGCTTKAFRREVVQNIRLYGEMHRFIPAIASAFGVRIAEMPVNHRPRRAGKSKYGLGRAPKVLLDLFTVKFQLSYATRPIQLFGLWGLVLGGAGFALALYYTIQRLFFAVPLWGKPGLILAVLLILVGVQLIGIGLLGEILVRTYHETQSKPTYTVAQILNREE